MLVETGVVAVVSIFTSFIIAYIALNRAFASRQDDPDPKPKRGVPYIFLNGVEDATAINIDSLIAIRDFLIMVENRLNDQRLLLGQIRNGEYEKDQPAASRRRNGESTK